MIYGYARVSTDGQSVDAQVKQLRAAGAEEIFRETASGARSDRAQLRRALDLALAYGDLPLPAQEGDVLVAKLTEWRDRALAGAATALKERERDDRDDEIGRLKSKVGEITMDNELLNAKIAALEGKRPLAHRRSRR